MFEIFHIEGLPDVDQQAIRKGRCPWCLGPLLPDDQNEQDYCAECDNAFVGELTIDID